MILILFLSLTLSIYPQSHRDFEVALLHFIKIFWLIDWTISQVLSYQSSEVHELQLNICVENIRENTALKLYKQLNIYQRIL